MEASDKIQLEILGLSSSQSGSFALLLGEVKGNRRLPIIIGIFEAQAIALEMEGITPNRPMTHDLFRAFSIDFGIDIIEIIISDLQEGVFFAQIVCERDGKRIEIDARPSDAIAIGLRFKVNIYSYKSIMEEAGLVPTDENGKIVTVEEAMASGDAPTEVTLENQSTDTLQEKLKSVLAAEDYEAAAKIRDEINHRN